MVVHAKEANVKFDGFDQNGRQIVTSIYTLLTKLNLLIHELTWLISVTAKLDIWHQKLKGVECWHSILFYGHGFANPDLTPFRPMFKTN